MEEKRTDLLALLLRPELPNVQKELPTAEYRVKRLSEALGTDVVFKLRALPYGKVKSIRDSVAGDPMLDILLAGDRALGGAAVHGAVVFSGQQSRLTGGALGGEPPRPRR
mgnify:CR=1 FL=1